MSDQEGLMVSARKSVTPKQVLTVIAGTVLLAAMGWWCEFGDRPSFTCGGEACAERGRCTGHRFECIVGSDDDCRRSKGCSHGGECSRVTWKFGPGQVCGAASQAECEHSEVCETDGRCFFLPEEQDCETQDQVRREQGKAAAQARDAASKSVAPWLALVQSAAGGAETSSGLAMTIAKQQLDGFEVETPAPTLVAMEVGTASWNGKRLPAAIVRVTVPFMNRSAGQRRDVCLVQAALHDEEFKMWRGMQTFGCQESGLSQSLGGWRSTDSFVATQVWPAPPLPGVDGAGATTIPSASATAAVGPTGSGR
jgi:hypothetical protein